MYSSISLSYSSLEPFLSDKTLKKHYDIYLKYVKKLNELLNGVDNVYSKDYLLQHIDVLPLSIRGEVLYNLSGVVNHELYFFGLSNENNITNNKLYDDIVSNFGSFEKFKINFRERALNIKGSGYTFLVIDKDKKFRIINTSNQDNPYYYGYIPIINLDVWEHAYYIDYYSNRENYIDNFFNKLDLKKLSINYENILNN